MLGQVLHINCPEITQSHMKGDVGKINSFDLQDVSAVPG